MQKIHAPEQARWISLADNSLSDQFDTVWFRHIIERSGHAPLSMLVSANSRYRMYLNGEFFSYGPCKSGDHYQYFDRLELTDRLKEGRNELLVQVVSFPDVENPFTQVGGPDWAVHPIRRAALAVIGLGDEGESLTTGVGEWFALRDASMEPVTNTTARWLGYTERAHIDRVPRIRDDEAGWERAVPRYRVNAGAFGEVPRMPAYERPIPPMELGPETALAWPDDQSSMTVEAHKSVSIEFDAGEETTAFVALRGAGGRSASVRIRYAEAYYERGADGELVKNERTPGLGRTLQGFADEILPDGKPFDYSPFWFRTFRYLRLEIETGDEALCLEAPRFRVTRYPLKAVSAVLGDQSGWVGPLWDISLRTLRLCMHETYEDCPYYEQMQYTMDTRLQMLFTYRVSGDTRLAKRTIEDYHASRLPDGALQSRYPSGSKQVIPAFSLHWIFMLRDYYIQTGDLAFVRRFFGTVDEVLGYFRALRTTDGLIGHVGYWAFIDWVDEWDRGVPDAETRPEGSHNFLYAYALGVAAELARAMRFDCVADAYEAEKADILRHAHAHFYDEARGLYRYDAEKPRFCQHTQVWAALAGVGDEAFRQGLLSRMMDDKTLLPCSFPMQYYLFRALESAGLYDLTAAQWDLWKKVLDQKLTTVPEIPINARSDCHAWGALLLYEYPARVLGVEPAAPGWSEIVIRPAALFMKNAEGRACVPDGYVDVTWRVENGTIELTCDAQTDIPVRVELPHAQARECGRGRKLTLSSAL